MASRQSDLARLYPQRKKSSTSGKGGRSNEKKDDLLFVYRGSGNSATASVGSGAAQPAALVTSKGQKDLSGDHDNTEETLCQFDMNSAYGPCMGMTRMERWDRAKKFGLNPPESIRGLLENLGASQDCLWEGRV